MKIAIFSDIHANYEALTAVFEQLQRHDCTKVICTGDVVGYGASPEACVQFVKEKNVLTIRGNHDDLVLNPNKEKRLRATVQESIQWTRTKLSDSSKKFLSELPRQLTYAGFSFVHSSNVIKPEWEYVINQTSLSANFLFQNSQITFNGHTHLPLIGHHEKKRAPSIDWLSEAQVRAGVNYLINVGSVGQPRDRNPMACYVIFDTRKRNLKLHRVAYDIETAQQKIKDAKLPLLFADRLPRGR